MKIIRSILFCSIFLLVTNIVVGQTIVIVEICLEQGDATIQPDSNEWQYNNYSPPQPSESYFLTFTQMPPADVCSQLIGLIVTLDLTIGQEIFDVNSDQTDPCNFNGIFGNIYVDCPDGMNPTCNVEQDILSTGGGGDPCNAAGSGTLNNGIYVLDWFACDPNFANNNFDINTIFNVDIVPSQTNWTDCPYAGNEIDDTAVDPPDEGPATLTFEMCFEFTYEILEIPSLGSEITLECEECISTPFGPSLQGIFSEGDSFEWLDDMGTIQSGILDNWGGNPNDDIIGQLTSTYCPDYSTTLTLEVTDANSCVTSSSVAINYDCNPCEAAAGSIIIVK